ncbi:unnamed protein product, partial [Ectocarpus sp. 6 AP-2014]
SSGVSRRITDFTCLREFVEFVGAKKEKKSVRYSCTFVSHHPANITTSSPLPGPTTLGCLDILFHQHKFRTPPLPPKPFERHDCWCHHHQTFIHEWWYQRHEPSISSHTKGCVQTPRAHCQLLPPPCCTCDHCPVNHLSLLIFIFSPYAQITMPR